MTGHSSERETAARGLAALRAGLLPVARCLVWAGNAGRLRAFPTGGSDDWCLVTGPSSERETAARGLAALRAGLLPVACCLVRAGNAGRLRAVPTGGSDDW